jgi:lipoteichoic acid synthase
MLAVAVAAPLFGSTLAPTDDGDLYGWRMQNLLSLTTQNSLYRSYSPGFLDSIRSEPASNGACGPVAHREPSPDILIVLLESFSSTFSPMYGGSRGAHPELERISLDGLRFTRFLANGFTTEHGLIAILGGRMPVFPAEVAPFSLKGNTAFAGHYGLTTSLPACLDSLGYHTEFLTTADLSFTNKGNWLRSIGFARVEGHDAPQYDGLPRRVFQSVNDSALYARVLDRTNELRADATPFLLVAEGVEGHGPYRGADGMIATLRSADASLGRFYDRLVASGFLDSGLVLLVSDHRVQQALTAEERASFGPEAAVRVPAVLLGYGVVAGEDSVPRHQMDVLPTLMRLLGSPSQTDDLATAMTLEPGPRCIPWLHGGRRDEIGALCGDEYVRIRLDGERTRLVKGAATDDSDQLIAAIHRSRIDGADPGRQRGKDSGL